MRPGCVAASTSSTARPRPRSGPSTSARWRRSSSTSCRRPRTCAASCARTRTSSTWTASSCSTSTSRASATYDTSEDAEPRPRAAVRAAPSRRDRAGAAPTSPRGTGRRARRRTELQLLWLAIGGVMAVALLVWLGVGETDTADAGPDPEPPPTATTPSPAPRSASPTPRPWRRRSAPKPIAIVLTGTGVNGCWVQVRGRDAQRARSSTRARSWPRARPRSSGSREGIWVHAANPAELAVTVGGKAHGPRTARRRRNFLITPTGAEERRAEARVAAPVRAAILVTGDEILRGRIQERNAGHPRALARARAASRSTGSRSSATTWTACVGGAPASCCAGAARPRLHHRRPRAHPRRPHHGGGGPGHRAAASWLDAGALAMVEARAARGSRGRRRDAPGRARRSRRPCPAARACSRPPGTAPGCLARARGAAGGRAARPALGARGHVGGRARGAGRWRALLARAGAPRASACCASSAVLESRVRRDRGGHRPRRLGPPARWASAPATAELEVTVRVGRRTTRGPPTPSRSGWRRRSGTRSTAATADRRRRRGRAPCVAAGQTRGGGRVLHRRAGSARGSRTRPGSSAYVLGGVISYARRGEARPARRDPEVIRRATARSRPSAPARWPRGRGAWRAATGRSR